MVGAAVVTTMTVSTAPPTTDCGMTMMTDNGANCGGLQDCSKARTTDVDNDPRGGNRHTTGAVNTLDCGNKRRVTGAMMAMMTMRKQMLVLAPTAVAAAAIAHCLLPKRRTIVGLSHKLLCKSSDNSAEGEDRQRHCKVCGRTSRGWGGGNKDNKDK